MRIVAGEHRGRVLEVPVGLDTRPTTDRVREAVMSSVFSKLGGFEGLHVLDAFSGTGAMGLEAMSRGASSAVLNDFSARSRECIEANARSLGYDVSSIPSASTAVSVTARDACRNGLPQGPAPYDLVFLDPPYAMDFADVSGLLRRALDAGILAQDCLVVYEHEADISDDEVPPGFMLDSEKRYGKTIVSYFFADGSD